MMRGTTNIYNLPSEVNRIKSYIVNGLAKDIEELNKHAVYAVDKETGNVIFPGDVSVEGDPNKSVSNVINNMDSMNAEMEQIERNQDEIRKELASIEGISDIESVVSIVDNVEKDVDMVKNNTAGLERNSLNTQTNINEPVVVNNDLIIGQDGYANMSICGFGGCSKLAPGIRIRCVNGERSAYWNAPVDVYELKDFYLLTLSAGIKTAKDDDPSHKLWRFQHVKGSIAFKAVDNTKVIKYSANLGISDGICEIDSGGMKIVLTIDYSSSFTRGTFTTDSITYGQSNYPISPADQQITLVTTNIRLTNDEIEIATNPILHIDSTDCQFTIRNVQELSPSEVNKVISFVASDTYLNAFVNVNMSDPEIAKAAAEFAEQYNFDVSKLNDFIYSGITINTTPSTGENAIKFKLPDNNNTISIKATHDDSTGKDLLNFSSDATFTFTNGSTTSSVKLSDLVNRVITLERKSWFIESSMIDNPEHFADHDAVTDASVINTYQNLNNPVYHV